jgi:anaerobic ribonucleoside-triphosphate reductase activating protein
MNRPKIDPLLALLEIPPGYLNLMGYVDESEVNGPGRQAVVWVQGCHRGCEGCFNRASWSFEINQLMSIDRLAHNILRNPRNTGVTFSGGEPFWQAPALANLARQVKVAGLNVMAFTGFTLEQLQDEFAPAGALELLQELDLLIDGPFVQSLALQSPNSQVASNNQRVHVLNSALQDQMTWASNQVEVHVLQDGSRIVTGYLGQLQPTE